MRKIRNKILSTMMLLTLLPVLLIGGYSFHATTDSLRELALNNQKNQLITNKKALENLLGNVKRDVLFLRDSSAVQFYLAGQQPLTMLGSALEQFVDENGAYSSVRLLDVSGQEVIHIKRRDGTVENVSKSGERLDESDAGYFKEASRLANNDIYRSPLELKRVNGDVVVPNQSIIRYATTVSDVSDQVQGVLVVELDADYLIEQAVSASPSKWRALVVNPQGFLYFSKQLGESVSEPDSLADQENIFTDTSALLPIKHSKNYQLLENDTDISLSVPITLGDEKESLGYLISVAPKAVLFKPLRDYLSISIIIVTICLVLSFLFAIILSNSLSEPLLRLTQKVKNFTQGDLDTPIETTVKNEIGDLSQAIELLRKSMVILMKRSRKA